MYAAKYDGGGADVAEYFPAPEDPEPGTVMTIDPAGGSKLMSSTKAYDTTVAGIVSTSPGVSLGTKEDGNDGEKLIAVVGSGGCEMTSASYAMQSTVGQTAIGATSDGYQLEAGYWYRDAGGVGGEPGVCGDLKRDGEVTAADAAIALEIAAGSRPNDPAANVDNAVGGHFLRKAHVRGNI